MGKQQQLDAVKQKILDDKVTPELAATATQLVFGSGNPDADIVFVGEAPGKNEDLKGEPFVGAAGKFLDEMLQSVNLQRSDIYITNIVKYRPPNNRDPSPEEKKAFLPYLQAQLEVIQPKVVITLGRHSTNCFLPDLQISKEHGRPKRVRLAFKKPGSLQNGYGADGVQGADEKRTEPYKSTVKGVSQAATQQSAAKLAGRTGSASQPDELTVVILPLFHPAAALYNGGLRQTLLDDFLTIPDIIKKISHN